MSTLSSEEVTSRPPLDGQLCSVSRTTRQSGFRFRSGQFAMIGLEVSGRPLLRAYSIASANYEEHLEFFSIKVQDGPLTSRLQHLKVGDSILVSAQADRHAACSTTCCPARNLYLLATGTGLAPFLSIIRIPRPTSASRRSCSCTACGRSPSSPMTS